MHINVNYICEKASIYQWIFILRKLYENACIRVNDNVLYKRKEKTEDKTLNIRHVT